MIGNSKTVKELFSTIKRAAVTDSTILITGESGTGKDLAAHLIYQNSNRSDNPFLAINCNCINDSLLESELFGHEKGSFTGAHLQRPGKFEEVNGGTIFLDEIGGISDRMQAALLRVLQNGEIIRVGGNMPTKTDVRVIAATNKDLVTLVRKGLFRLDLFYRLNVITIRIPPLRERKEDLFLLVDYFVERYQKRFAKKITFPEKLISSKLCHYEWPGNIRELENVVQRAVLMCKNNTVTESDLILYMEPNNYKSEFKRIVAKYNGSSLKTIIRDVEKQIITEHLKQYRGNVARTASELSVCKAALYDKIKKYDISIKQLKTL